MPNAPLLVPFCNRNKTVCGCVNRKNSIEDFQNSEVLFPVGILAHLNELQEGDGIIQNQKFQPQSKLNNFESCIKKHI